MNDIGRIVRLTGLMFLASLIFSIPTSLMTVPTNQLTHESNEKAVKQVDGSIVWVEIQ